MTVLGTPLPGPRTAADGADVRQGVSKMAAHVEYMGFKCVENTREYALRVHQGANILGHVTMVIQNSAFLTKAVRYQDGPDLCFHKLQSVIALSPEAMPERIVVSEADYVTARAPRASTRRAKPLPPAGS